MVMKLDFEIRCHEPKSRKIYTVPTLTNYGLVRDLTQSGTMGNRESFSFQTFMCTVNTSQRPCSERSVKENIVRIGDHPLGFGLYLFDYRAEYRERWGNGRQFGVMIDEVETVVPEAVFGHPDGYKRVDYGILGITRLTY